MSLIAKKSSDATKEKALGSHALLMFITNSEEMPVKTVPSVVST